MPAGVAPLVVLEPANAALAAAKIIGLVEPAIRERVRTFQAGQRRRVLDADAAIRDSLDDLQIAAPDQPTRPKDTHAGT